MHQKIFLEILKMRINYYVGPHIGEEQFGFVQGKGTADAMLTIRNIIEKTQKKQGSQLWLMFVDYSKAFDTVAHNILWNTLIEFGTPYHLVWLIKKLMKVQKVSFGLTMVIQTVSNLNRM